jgi:hypothetical protein
LPRAIAKFALSVPGDAINTTFSRPTTRWSWSRCSTVSRPRLVWKPKSNSSSVFLAESFDVAVAAVAAVAVDLALEGQPGRTANAITHSQGGERRLVP